MKSFTKSKPVLYLSTLLVFLYPSTLLVGPSSYSWLPALIAILSLLFFVTTRKSIANNKSLKVTFWLVSSYFLAIVASWYWFDGPSKQLDIPNRIIFLLPIAAFFITYPPKIKYLFLGIALGGLLSGSISAYMHFGMGLRALGSLGYMPIQASGMAMTLGVFSLIGLFYARGKKDSLLSGFCALGFLGGVGASFLSGGRGAWVIMPFVAIALCICYRHQISKRLILVALIMMSGVVYFSYPVIEHRVKAVITDLQAGGAYTSSSIRIELWKAAYYVGIKSPIFGVGLNNVIPEKKKVVAEGLVSNEATLYGHAHNQFLDAFQERGVIGLGTILLMCIAPIMYFRKQYKIHRNTDKEFLAVMGICHIVLLMGYFLTQTFLAHHSGILLYTTFTAIFMAMCSDDKVSSESNTS